MRTNIVLDDDLVAEASRLSGIKTKKDLVDEANVCYPSIVPPEPAGQCVVFVAALRCYRGTYMGTYVAATPFSFSS